MRPPAYRPRAAWPNDRVFKCEEFAVSMANDDFDIVVNQLRELHLNANK